MSGKVLVIGLGQGEAASPTAQALAGLARASGIIGYSTYVRRVLPQWSDAPRHEYDNGTESERAIAALEMALAGETIAVVCGGDPGVFGMAARLLEERARHPRAIDAVEVEVMAGVTAAQAAAARFGAALGDDYCCLTLSDLLRSADEILFRLEAALEGGFNVAIYNPASRSRRNLLMRATRLILQIRGASQLVCLANGVGFEGECLDIVPVGSLDISQVNMNTIMLVPSANMRVDVGRKVVYAVAGGGRYRRPMPRR